MTNEGQEEQQWRVIEYNPTESSERFNPDAREWEFWSGEGKAAVSHAVAFTPEARDRIIADHNASAERDRLQRGVERIKFQLERARDHSSPTMKARHLTTALAEATALLEEKTNEHTA